jgi:hypothetical protein
MQTSQTQPSHLAQRALAALTALAAVAALLAGLGSATASADAASESIFGPSMSLTFTKANAKVTGSGALVSVKCEGPVDGTCVGTLALRVGSSTHKAPFSVLGGNKQTLVVPLGDDGEAAAGHRIRAVASTVQPLGAPTDRERTLRLR